MTFTVYPGDANTVQVEWPLVAKQPGIIEDFFGTAFAATPSGSSTTTTIAPGSIALENFWGNSDAVVTVDHGGSPAPGAGQKRCDLVVARYDWSKPLATAFSVVLKPGNVVSASADSLASLPLVQRARGVICETPLHGLQRLSGGLPTIVRDFRAWAPNYVDPAYETAPIGSLRLVGDALQRRVLVGGSPAWRTLSDNQPSRQVFRNATPNSTHAGSQWNPVPITSPFGGRGPAAFTPAVGFFGREFQCVIPGDYSLMWTGSFDQPNTAMRFTYTAPGVTDVIAQTRDAPGSSSRSDTLVVPSWTFAAGDLLGLQAFCAINFTCVVDQGSTGGIQTNPASPNKLFISKIN